MQLATRRRSLCSCLIALAAALTLGACSSTSSEPAPSKAPANELAAGEHAAGAPAVGEPVAGAQVGGEQAAASAEQDAAGLADGDAALARRLVRDEGALLLDVRSVEEFEGGHVEGAKNIAHTDVAARVDEIAELQGGDKRKPIVVYCRAGRRAGIAKQALLDAGLTQVSNLGGMSSWCEDC